VFFGHFLQAFSRTSAAAAIRAWNEERTVIAGHGPAINV
jgi:hypothetical protein